MQAWTGMSSLDSLVLRAVDTLEIASSLTMHRPDAKPENDVVSIEVELPPQGNVGTALGLR